MRKMFKNFTSILLITLFFISSSVLADPVEGVHLEPSTTCANETLHLNGAGVRKKFFIKLYVAALYTPEQINDAQQVLNMNIPMCMRLHIISSKITAEKLVNATRKGFEQATKNKTGEIEKEIEHFLSWLDQPISVGDVFQFSFTPTKTIQVFKNQLLLGEIMNTQFSHALFAIWLGEAPVQDDLKDGLLGNQN